MKNPKSTYVADNKTASIYVGDNKAAEITIEYSPLFLNLETIEPLLKEYANSLTGAVADRLYNEEKRGGE